MKLKLTIDSVTDDFFANTHILGIVAPVSDYHLCWQLNHLLNIDFRRSFDLEIESRTKGGRKCFFNIYQYTIPNTPTTHYLYNNEYEGDYLLTEYKNFDFIWLIKSDSDDFEDIDVEQIKTSIKSLPQVQLVIEIAQERIKQKADLMF